MGTISVTLPSDGSTIDAADVNTPINAILSEFNGNIDNDNIKSGAAISGSKLADASITNAKLSTTAGELGGAWQSWTPTWTNLTIGNGTVSAYYTQIGKTVVFRLSLTFGSTTSVSGNVRVSLPVARSSNYSFTALHQIAGGIAFESGVGAYAMVIDANGDMYTHQVSGADISVSSFNATRPFTWGTADTVSYSGTYEAA